MLYIVQVNFFSFIILAFIFLQILKSKNPLSNEKQYYLWVVITTAFVVLLDIILQFINGTPGPFLHNLHLFLVYLFYVFNPVPFFLWTALIWEYLSKQHAKNSLLMIAYATPAIIYFVLATIASAFF